MFQMSHGTGHILIAFGVCVGLCGVENFISLGEASYTGLALGPYHMTSHVQDQELGFGW